VPDKMTGGEKITVYWCSVCRRKVDEVDVIRNWKDRAGNCMDLVLCKCGNKVQDLDSALDSLVLRVQDLETALGFYADPRRYQGPNQRAEAGEESEGGYRIDITRDGGRKARAALDGENGTWCPRCKKVFEYLIPGSTEGGEGKFKEIFFCPGCSEEL